MTPDPPEPPTPTGREYPARLGTTFNNAHVIRIYHGDELLTGGVTTIGTLVDIDPIIANDSGEYRVSAKVKAYNNAYTDWQDPYYDDASDATISGGSTYNVGSRDDGTGFTFTLSGSTSLGVSVYTP